jgi:hypothetical protein
MPMGPGVRRAVLGLGLALACATGTPRASVAAPSPPPGELRYSKTRSFRIPFKPEEEDRARIKEVQLFASTDQGQSWQPVSRTTLDQTAFPTFRAPRDAEYWFAVRTIDTKGRLYPTDNAQVEPGLRVIVDTTAPVLELKPGGRRGEWASVQWEIRDENLDPKSLSIQYKAEGARDWRQVPLQNTALIGAHEWQAGTASALVVRASVSDKAGNSTKTEIMLPDGIAAAPSAADAEDVGFEAPPPIAPITSAASLSRGPLPRPARDEYDGFAPAAAQAPPRPPARDEFEPAAPAPAPRSGLGTGPAVPRTLQVASPQFSLQYSVEDAGPEGPALVELWVTRDGGQSWTRQPPDPDRVSPYPVDLGGEGAFGLWLVVQSAASLGDAPPQPGDRPQLWVEVDSTPPDVHIEPPRIGIGRNLGKVLITWAAADPHLGTRPVLLSYRADRPDAPWTPLADRLDNTGKFVWTLPQNVPPRIHLRIDVVDSLGNRNFAETTAGGPILVDRSKPRGRILGLDTRASEGLSDRSRQ